MRLSPETSLLIVIDVQEKLFATMYEQKKVKDNIVRMVEGAKILNVPIIWTEQYPKGLGPTIPELRATLGDHTCHEKITFSCAGDDQILKAVEKASPKDILLCGIEAHVCVYQTAADFIERGKRVHLVSDAVMSRHKSNHEIALRKMEQIGVNITSVEMVLFEFQRVARGETFKPIAALIK
ncbi:MAG: hydrolase [Candidatus Marinimicrobia bacterium]|jgi:nicotinamidase-related amidase|nr:hydrolase [Candidatus Neomarinimicrobiota bacterium]|tara:strand:+ start:2766 stop:3308 length:543 start_codon:yes stop_codon:yes gene_type:complete